MTMTKSTHSPAFTGSELLNTYYQRRVSLFIGFISSLVFFPLAVKNLLIDYVLLGGLIIVFQCTLLIEITAIYYQKKTPCGIGGSHRGDGYSHFRHPRQLLAISRAHCDCFSTPPER